METVLAASAGQLTLVSDSWTNQRTESVVNYVALTRQHAIFLKTEYTGSERHTGEAIARGLKQAIKEIGGGEAVIAVTTDNASNMKKAWQYLQQDYPTILTLGCASHTVNLTVEDLLRLPGMKTLLQSTVTIVKYFKSSTILTGALNDVAKAEG